MTPPPPPNQLEFFDLARSQPPRPRRMAGAWCVSLRHDHLTIAAMAALIGYTVVFAVGVERGKRIARAEAPTRMATPLLLQTPRAPEPVTVAAPARAASEAPSAVPAAPVAPAKPKASPKRLAQGSTFAVQVITYRQRGPAQREMQRLQSRGERAFLVMTDGHTRVLIGPFDSKGHARAKLTQLRDRYRDCFVRSL